MLNLRTANCAACFLSIIALFPSVAGAQRTEVCRASSADKPAIAKTVRGLFAAAQKDDAAAFNALVTPGFYIFDGGKRYDSDGIIKSIADYHEQGYKFVWTVPDPTIEVDCNTAWIAYENAGSITLPNGVKHDQKWLESAFLIKSHGRWKVRFFHSTQEK